MVDFLYQLSQTSLKIGLVKVKFTYELLETCVSCRKAVSTGYLSFVIKNYIW